LQQNASHGMAGREALLAAWLCLPINATLIIAISKGSAKTEYRFPVGQPASTSVPAASGASPTFAKSPFARWRR